MIKQFKLSQISKFLYKRSTELVLLVIIILLLAKITNLHGLFDRLNLFKVKQPPISSTQPTPTPKCKEEDLHIDTLADYLKNNGLVLTLLRQNCEIVLGSDYFDVTGDSTPDILLTTSFAGCASCHSHIVRVIDGTSNQIIFALGGDDLVVTRPTFPITGFRIIEPLRWHDVPFCCATEGLAYTYIYSPKDKRGSSSDIDSTYHGFASYNTVRDNDFFYLYDTRSIQFNKN